MSGIAGVVRFDGGPVDPELVRGMTAAMAHRGPDGIAHWAGGSVALGHCMLRTTPESFEEKQPLVSDDGRLVLVMDGRVDNWEEMRARLLAEGAGLRTRADAELVLQAYRRWGRDCLDHIDGDFALVIWDADRRELFCARDRIGWKPLHYHWDGTHFSFASELRSILELPWVPEEINEGIMAEALSLERISLEETVWRGVLRLVAGRRMFITSRGVRSEEYWRPDLLPDIRYRRLDDYVEHYRAELLDAVRRRSRSHAPLACEVSGGLDSSAVFAFAEELRRAGGLLSPGLEGYTLYFGDGSGADEIEYARAVGRYLGRELHEIPPTVLPLAWYREWARRNRELPFAPNMMMNLGLYAASHDAGSRVILTGLGGDEWLMGSPYYYCDFLQEMDIAGFIRALVSDARLRGTKAALRRSVRFGPFAMLPDRVQNFLRSAAGKKRKPAFTPEFPLARRGQEIMRERSIPDRPGPGRLRRPHHSEGFATLNHALTAYLQGGAELVDAGAGIERRHPLTSKGLVEFYFRTPERIRQAGDQFRVCHRLAMKGKLPEAVRNRVGKAEFSVVSRRYPNEFRAGGEFPLEGYARLWFAPEQFSTMLAEADGGTGQHAARTLWAIFGCAALAGDDIDWK